MKKGIVKEDIYYVDGASEGELKTLDEMCVWREKGLKVIWDEEEERWFTEDGDSSIPSKFIEEV